MLISGIYGGIKATQRLFSSIKFLVILLLWVVELFIIIKQFFMLILKSSFKVCFKLFRYSTNIILFTDPDVLEANTISDELIEVINDVESSKQIFYNSWFIPFNNHEFVSFVARESEDSSILICISNLDK